MMNSNEQINNLLTPIDGSEFVFGLHNHRALARMHMFLPPFHIFDERNGSPSVPGLLPPHVHYIIHHAFQKELSTMIPRVLKSYLSAGGELGENYPFDPSEVGLTADMLPPLNSTLNKNNATNNSLTNAPIREMSLPPTFVAPEQGPHKLFGTSVGRKSSVGLNQTGKKNMPHKIPREEQERKRLYDALLLSDGCREGNRKRNVLVTSLTEAPRKHNHQQRHRKGNKGKKEDTQNGGAQQGDMQQRVGRGNDRRGFPNQHMLDNTQNPQNAGANTGFHSPTGSPSPSPSQSQSLSPSPSVSPSLSPDGTLTAGVVFSTPFSLPSNKPSDPPSDDDGWVDLSDADAVRHWQRERKRYRSGYYLQNGKGNKGKNGDENDEN